MINQHGAMLDLSRVIGLLWDTFGPYSAYQDWPSRRAGFPGAIKE